MLDTYREDHGGSLSGDQIRFYDVEGYLVLRGLLTDEDLRPAREAMERKVDVIAAALLAHGKIDDLMAQRPFSHRLADLFRELTDADFLTFGRGWRDRDPGYYDIMANPKILDAVESLIGPEIFSNPVYNTRPKVPKVAAGAVPWHQDKSYWPDSNANPVISVWLPFVAANRENGCLWIMPRTHRQKLKSWHAEQYSGTGFLEIDGEHVPADRKPIPLLVEAGDAILFNDRCIHRSEVNRSASVRWSLDLRYQLTDQDEMPSHGVGFLARSRRFPERVADREDWIALRTEHGAAPKPGAR